MAVTSWGAVSRGQSLHFSALSPCGERQQPQKEGFPDPRAWRAGESAEETAPPPYLRRSSRRRSRIPSRGIHTGARSTRPARSRGRCRPRSRTGPGRGTERPLGAARAPCSGARTRPGTACTWRLARFCMGDKPQQALVKHGHCSRCSEPTQRQTEPHEAPHCSGGHASSRSALASPAKGATHKLSPEK